MITIPEFPDVEFPGLEDGGGGTPANDAWKSQFDNIVLSAATYQYFTGRIPEAEGFAYLISSPDNDADLNDPYYRIFNTENRFINFANNLGSFGEGRSDFLREFGSLSFEQAVTKAFEQIIGSAAVRANGGNPDDSLKFFLDAYDYYSDVALERVVPGGVSFDHAVKVVAIGSILNEALKAGIGPYANAITEVATDITTSGHTAMYGMDVLGWM